MILTRTWAITVRNSSHHVVLAGGMATRGHGSRINLKKEKTVGNTLNPRLRYSLFYPALQADFGDKVYGLNWEWNNDEAWFRKYQRDYFRTNEDYFAQNNVRLIRFADILLMYAETLNEL